MVKRFLNMLTPIWLIQVVNSKRSSLTNKDIDWLVPHQANRRIDATTSRMNLESKVFDEYRKEYGIPHLQLYL
jgi:hypothetical protein